MSAFGSPVRDDCGELARSLTQARSQWETTVADFGGLHRLRRAGDDVAAAVAPCGVGCHTHRADLWVAWASAGGDDPQAEYEAARRCTPAEADEAQVQLDLLRTAPGHPWFSHASAPGIEPLRRVLLALSVAQPYVQGQNFAACFCISALALGTLSLDESDERVRSCLAAVEASTFVVLRSLLHTKLGDVFYSNRMTALRADIATISARFQTHAGPTGSRIASALAEWHVDLDALLPRMALCAFVGAAPDEAVLRLWDIMLCAPATYSRAICMHAAEALLHCAAGAIERNAVSDTQDIIAILRSSGKYVTDVTILCAAAGAAVLRELARSPGGKAARRQSLTPPPSARVLRSSTNTNTPGSRKRKSAAPLAPFPPFLPLEALQGTATAMWQPFDSVLKSVGIGVPTHIEHGTAAKRARTSRAAVTTTLEVAGGGNSLDAPGIAAAASPSSWLCSTPCRSTVMEGGTAQKSKPGVELTALKSRRQGSGTSPTQHRRC